MRKALLLPFVLVASAAVAGTASASGPLTFTVPIEVNHLHPDLTLVRARCAVFADRRWQTMDVAIAEGTSQPSATEKDGDTRGFIGDLDVPVWLNGADPVDARSYRCALELYDAATQQWSDADTMAKRYPIDRTVMAVTAIGGPLN